jgi:hypothetical protein
MIGGSYSDKRLVRFPSSFGTGPDSALIPTVLVIFKEKNVRLLEGRNCSTILSSEYLHGFQIS